MDGDYEKRNKLAASHLTTIAEALREVAWTEAGEIEHPNVRNVCTALLKFAGVLDAYIVWLRQGNIAPTRETDDIPF